MVSLAFQILVSSKLWTTITWFVLNQTKTVWKLQNYKFCNTSWSVICTDSNRSFKNLLKRFNSRIKSFGAADKRALHNLQMQMISTFWFWCFKGLFIWETGRDKKWDGVTMVAEMLQKSKFLSYVLYLCYIFYYIFIIYSYVYYMFFIYVIYFYFHIIWFKFV